MDFTGHLNYSGVSGDTEPELGVETDIHDARTERTNQRTSVHSRELLLNGPGFLLITAPSKVSDWTDINEVAHTYYAETQALAQSLLPSFDVSPITSHTYRTEHIKEHHWIEGVQYGPCAEFVHNDYADFLTPDRQDIAKSFAEVMGMPTNRRVIGINIWRSVTETPLERFPLAVCDRKSIDPEDLVYELNPNAPKPFNAHYCRPNSGQHWHYFSDMNKDEVLVFTTYDSKPDDGKLFRPTLHTAVDMPGSKGKTPRVSVEVRFFAYQ